MQNPPLSSSLCEEIELPVIPVPEEYPEAKLCLLRLPPFITFDPCVYDERNIRLQDVTQFEEEDSSVASARLAATVRWKIANSNSAAIGDNPISSSITYDDMLSNANLVQWSDDTYSIAIGSDIYDLNFHPVGHEEHLHVFSQHQDTSLMEDVGRVSEKIFVRQMGPTATGRITPRAHSEAKVKIAVMPQDPEAARIEMEKIAAEKQRLKQRQEAVKRKQEEKLLRKENSRSSLTKDWLEDRSTRQVSYDRDEIIEEEEEDEDYEEEDISDEDEDEKDQVNNKERDYDSEEDDFDLESRQSKFSIKRGAIVSDDDTGDDGDDKEGH